MYNFPELNFKHDFTKLRWRIIIHCSPEVQNDCEPNFQTLLS